MRRGGERVFRKKEQARIDGWDLGESGICVIAGHGQRMDGWMVCVKWGQRRSMPPALVPVKEVTPWAADMMLWAVPLLA